MTYEELIALNNKYNAEKKQKAIYDIINDNFKESDDNEVKTLKKSSKSKKKKLDVNSEW